MPLKLASKWLRREGRKDEVLKDAKHLNPMHKQPVYADALVYTNDIEVELFKVGMCLPSGPCVTDDDVVYIVESIKEGDEIVVSKPSAAELVARNI